MEIDIIAKQLAPFLTAPPSPVQLEHISMYIDMLLRWNHRINLTAIRSAQEIASRHFGESLFAAQHLFPGPARQAHVVDVGSGAGFPGLPIKLWVPVVSLTLIESNRKKAVFLREVVRALALREVEVFGERAENYPAASADVVTMRAVEQFESVLPVVAQLVKPGGRIALLIGADQVSRAQALLPQYQWDEALPVPQSEIRVFLVGKHS